MKSQRSGAGRGRIRRFGLTWRYGSGEHLIAWIFWLLCSAAFGSGAVQAQSTGYVYDANGRIVAVTAGNSTSAQYGYNTLGHTRQVSTPIATSQLAIFAFSPTHGELGTEVIIQGQDFDPNAANDVVAFNGTTAPVTEATASQLTVHVPAGATSGPISIAADSQAATSATSFSVDGTGLAPVITSIAPVLVSVGGTVTVAGSHFEPSGMAPDTDMGGATVIPGLVSDTQIQFPVSNSTKSGYVTVANPYGKARSANPIIVLPGGMSASNVSSVSYLQGSVTNATVTIASAGQEGLVTFNGQSGAWVSLQLANIATTAGTLTYSIYSPTNAVVQQGTVSASNSSIHVHQLSVGGTYLVAFQSAASGVQFVVTSEKDRTVSASQSSVTTAFAGQSERLIVPAVAGQPLTLQVSTLSTNPANQLISYAILTPAYQALTSVATATIATLPIPVPMTGSYQLIVSPGANATGTAQAAVVSGDNVVVGEASAAFSGYSAGQTANVPFTANAGDNLEVLIDHLQNTNGDPVHINVLDANGTNLASGSCQGSTSECRLPVWNLAGGTYTIQVVPWWGNDVVTFNATVQPDVVGGALALNTPVTATLANGQVERFTLNATAGQDLSLSIAGITTTPSGQPVQVSVYSPGTILTTNALLSTSYTGSGTLQLSNLPATGTYTVVVSTTGLPASLQMTLAAVTASTNGQAGTYTGYLAGETANVPFTANAGDNLEVLIDQLQNTNGDPVHINVLDANGTNLASGSCRGSTSECRLPVWNLAGGTYTIQVVPWYSNDVVAFNATVQPDVVGPALIAGGTSNVALGVGQVERTTFTANTGDSYTLTLSGVSSDTVYVNVYDPSVGTITPTNASTSFNATSSNTVNLSNLSAGTYTVITYTGDAQASSAQLSLKPAPAN
ncbi:beta strand repeat-containing protein [Caballeronia ptereochthonis]|uniref:IPT/TIG domain-containing protein n=1 Tax=Caballeronia ptereochthonis TaxID=1777144 RepID=A0A157Z2H4_9BURK|nr:IPT/TIG domain-containing protein [Caballeronia ptereochthonis]SAK39714.1 hypothetical protein AWB83_00112 [Caballeronia ptereochthonis]